MSTRKKLLNPFRPTRWEYETQGDNLIWFTRNSERLLEDKPVYVYGNRGSGKTTLLKSICWEDLTSNASLRMQRKLEDSGYIGIYIRLPDHVRNSMGSADWSTVLPESPDPAFEEHVFFSLAIESVCAHKLLEALNTLRQQDHIKLSAASEISVVKNLIAEFPKLSEFCDRTPSTLLELSFAFKNLVRRMNESSGRGQLQKLVPKLPDREPNELLLFLCENLSNGTKYNRSLDQKIRFKFCIDDCEVMSAAQIRSINTLLRKSHSPVSWVFCSVGELPDISSTFIPEQPITDDDRLVIPLNIDNSREFTELCQAVASLRLYFALPEKHRPEITGTQLHTFFDIKKRLSANDTNFMFQQLIADSKGALALAIDSAAEFMAIEAGSGDKPYYKAYLLAHWNGGNLTDGAPRDSFDATVDTKDLMARVKRNLALTAGPSFDDWLRRKRIAALLHFSSRLGAKRIAYYGHDVITHLSDRSIRDFLEILACIFDEYLSKRASARGLKNELDNSTLITAVKRFANDESPIAQKIQTLGIYNASEASFAQLRSQSDDQPEMMTSLVDALGRYTELLQSNHEDAAVLATAERGVFFVQKSQGNDEFLDLVEKITRRAVLAGYLRYVPLRRQKDTSSSLQKRFQGFRLRKRFAPKFGFSYRGAYEVVSIGVDFFEAALRPSSTNNIQSWLSKVKVNRPSADTDQLVLPLEVSPEFEGSPS